MKRKVVLSIVLSSLIIISCFYEVNPVKGYDDYFFKLRIVIPSPIGHNADYGLFIANYLEDINIEAEVIVPNEWPNWVDYLSDEYNRWDIAVVSAGEIKSPDMRDYYTQEGAFNVFKLDSSIPYYNETENLLNLYAGTLDLEERWSYIDNWQKLFMDKVLPMLPTFRPREYEGIWNNTQGYDSRWGIADSLPYLEFSGLHDGQLNSSIFNIGNYQWYDLNPISHLSESEALVASLLYEPLVTFSPDLMPLKTGIVKNWTKIEDHHYEFELRDNVWWSPSYNTTQRNASSIPLSAIPNEDLLVGLKGEYSSGTNQKVTAKDAVFSLLLHSHPDISNLACSYGWISKCYVDPINDLKFHIEMDAVPETPSNEIYSDFWSQMSVPLLPEFFLNSTSMNITQTAGGQEYIGLYPEIIDTPEWKNFRVAPFGCGKYMLDYSIKYDVTVLQKNPNWFGIGAIDGTPQDLDIETINIYFSHGGENELAEFLLGNLDWMQLTILPAQRRTMQVDSRFEIQTHIGYDLNFIAFNLNSEKVGGVNNNVWLNETGKTDYTNALAIRKAICYAIDLEEINQVMHYGEYLRTHHPNPRIPTWYYWDDLFKYEHDEVLAWEWLNAAGYWSSSHWPYPPDDTPTTIGLSSIALAVGIASSAFSFRRYKRLIKRV